MMINDARSAIEYVKAWQNDVISRVYPGLATPRSMRRAIAGTLDDQRMICSSLRSRGLGYGPTYEGHMAAVSELEKALEAMDAEDEGPTGYVDCACRDCFEGPVIGTVGNTLCDGCEEAGCDLGDYECRNPDAYRMGEDGEGE